MMAHPVFPFTAIEGQERMKRALILNVIEPQLGGVLIRGEKGTAKSTAVRALARLLPEIEVVEGCPFQSHPRDPALMSDECRQQFERGETLPAVRRPMAVVDLPLGATEDRVIGSLDFEAAIQQGRRAFQPGLLAAAHRGILYVDEINLLEDHLVDVLLDAAAMGVNTIEREGVSCTHPARFALVGTMNPEEGELRPQLLDRFGLCVEVAGCRELDQRARVVERRLAYEADPAGFCAAWTAAERELAEQILAAQAVRDEVVCSPGMIRQAASIALEMETQGHRAELAMVRTARAIAAWHLRREVTIEDLREAAELVLPHRMRRAPFEDPGVPQERLDQCLQRHAPPPPSAARGDAASGDAASGQEPPRDPGEPPSAEPPPEPPPETGGSSAEQLFAPREPFAVGPLPAFAAVREQGRSGGRMKQSGPSSRGRYVGTQPGTAEMRAEDVALDATLRAAAARQAGQGAEGAPLRIQREDLQEKVRERKVGSTIVFVVDSSGSMGARQRMIAAKEAILSLLLDAYQKRDRVGLVAFRGQRAEVLLPPTSSVELAKRNLEQLPTGGKTPFADGLQLGHQLLRTECLKEVRTQPLLIVVSDGRANVSLAEDADLRQEVAAIATRIRADGIASLVLDTEAGPVQLGEMQRLAEALGGAYSRLDDLRGDRIADLARQTVGREVRSEK